MDGEICGSRLSFGLNQNHVCLHSQAHSADASHPVRRAAADLWRAAVCAWRAGRAVPGRGQGGGGWRRGRRRRSGLPGGAGRGPAAAGADQGAVRF